MKQTSEELSCFTSLDILNAIPFIILESFKHLWRGMKTIFIKKTCY